MQIRFLRGADPFVQLVFLFLLALFSAGLFVLLAQQLAHIFWGLDLADPRLIYEYPENHFVLHGYRLMLLFQHVGLFILPSLLFASLAHRRPFAYLLLHRPPSPEFLWAAIVLMVLSVPLINALHEWNQQMSLPESMSGLESVLRGSEEAAQMLTEMLIYVDSPMGLAINLVLIALLPAIGEELLFRGLLMRILARWTGRVHLAVWVSAASFSFLHFQFYGFLPRLALGALLGYLVVWSGSLFPAILAHFVNNAAAVTIAWLVHHHSIDTQWEEIGAEGMPWYQLVGVCVLFLLGVLWAVRISHWRTHRRDYLGPE